MKLIWFLFVFVMGLSVFAAILEYWDVAAAGVGEFEGELAKDIPVNREDFNGQHY